MNKFEKVSLNQYLKDGGKTEDYEDIILPCRATAGSSGYDLFSPIDFKLEPGETKRIPMGIRMHLDSDKWLFVMPRGGLGTKYRLQLDNTVGNIDSDYINSDNEGHIHIQITNDSLDGKGLHIKKGDAITQGVITMFFKTIDDVAERRRNGGFGSTSKSAEIDLSDYESVFDTLVLEH